MGKPKQPEQAVTPSGRSWMELPAPGLIDLNEGPGPVGERQYLELRPTAPPGIAPAGSFPGGNGPGASLLVQPLHLRGALVGSDQRGLQLEPGGPALHFRMALERQREQWVAMRGAPPQHGYYVVDQQGVPALPAAVGQVWERVGRVLELYWRARYRDFVLAELAWLNNGLWDWELAAEAVRTGKVKAAARAEFYRVRFSGKVAEMRAGEAQVLAWLEEHPEGSAA